MNIVIGSGPSGLVAANFLKQNGVDFQLYTAKTNGWSQSITEGMRYCLGQRTMFYNDELSDYLDNLMIPIFTNSLKEKIGVYFEGEEYNYPIQNDVSNFGFWNKLLVCCNYLFRNRGLVKNNNYVDWVRGNYGTWLANNVILPHTWKTIKEDLYTIGAKHYGKKVVSMNLFKETEEVYEFSNPFSILDYLQSKVDSNIEYGLVKNIDLKNKRIGIVYDGKEHTNINYDNIISTIALNKLYPLIKDDVTDTLEVAFKSLRWNNLLVLSFVVPTDLVYTKRKIIYFPERQYPFSKVTFDRKNGQTIISAEISFRRNDEELFQSKAYLDKFIENVEMHLKDSGLVSKGLFLSYHVEHSIITPAYIICDEDYERSNYFIQNFLEHHNFYNIGRFAEWKPNLRIEHSLQRINKIYENL
jgi:protoporphyrinogen oxidase